MIYKILKSAWLPVLLSFFLQSCDNDDVSTPDFFGQGEYQGSYFPTSEWRECAPENVGVNSSKLLKAYNYAANTNINTDGIVIIKDGYIIGEAYFRAFKQSSRHTSYSIAKSFTSALVGIAIDEGLITGVNDSISKYYTSLQASDVQTEKKQVTIRHLLTMTGGFEWNEDSYYHGATNDIIEMIASSDDYITYVLSKPVVRTPGEEWYYSSGESILLAGIVEEASGMSAYNYAQENLFQNLGINRLVWSTDPSGHNIGGWGISTTLREFAKFGYLYLNNGSWDGKQLISESWVTESTQPSAVDYYGYQWWLGCGFLSHSNLAIPSDTYMAIGIYTQYIIIIPSENLLIVRMGNDVPEDTPEWDTAEFIKLILDAIES